MNDPFLEMRHISKNFPGVQALNDVSISVNRGEVRALVGENGAGKSTLIKILSGASQPDQGEIWLRGVKVDYYNPLEALALGIGAIYQEFNLVPQLSVAQNIMLGQMPTRWGWINRPKMYQQAQAVLEQLGVALDPSLIVGELNVAQQQIVEIAKGLARDLQIFIMDEPTATLNLVETEHLFHVIRTLKSRGVTILYISHRLQEIFEIADSVTVLKDGEVVGTKPIKALTSDQIVQMMIGRQLSSYYPPRATAVGNVVLKAKNLNLGDSLVGLNLELHQGEILGIAGLEGHGQRELVQALFGAMRLDSGEIYRDNQLEPINISSPIAAIQAGIGLVPDDRKRDGLVLIRPVSENIALPSLRERTNAGFFVNRKRERVFEVDLIQKLKIRAGRSSQAVINLSGGNQQKVVMAKWLGMEPKILIVAEPTRGVDVGSKSEIHHILRELANNGVGILMISSELPEILGMSDRILVIFQGQIVAEMSGEGATEEAIMAAATGHLTLPPAAN